MVSSQQKPEIRLGGNGTDRAVKRVLIVGDSERLQVYALKQNYRMESLTCDSIAMAERQVRSPEDWGEWDVLYLDSGAATDTELLEFLQRHQPALQQHRVNVVVLLSRRHQHLVPSIHHLAKIVDQDSQDLALLAADLGLRAALRAQRTGHVLVASAKGGVGKTSVAQIIAGYSARVLKKNVIMVDGDLFDGDLASTMGVVDTARSVLELAANVRHKGMRPEVLEPFLTPTNWGVRILASPASSTYRSGLIDPGIVAQIYSGLAGAADMIVTDAPPDLRQATPISPALFAPERAGDLTVLVLLGPRKAEREGCRRMIDFLHARGALQQAWLVYVQTRPFRREKDTDLVRGLERYAEESGLRGVAGQLPYSFVVEDAQERGVPFWDVRPRGLVQSLSWMLGGSPLQNAGIALTRRVWELLDQNGAGTRKR